MAGQHPRLPARLPRLTSRQEEVLELIARGLTNFEIAEQLGISLEGAKYHVREIMARLDATSRGEAVEVWRAGRRERSRPVSWLRGAIGVVGTRWAATAGVAAIGIGGAVAVAAVFIAADDDAPTLPPSETQAATASPGASGTPPTTTLSSSPGTTPGVPASTTPAPPTPAPTPPPVGPYPLGTRTGDPVIDAVIAAVEARDLDALFELIHHAPVECANPTGPAPAPPHTFLCPNDEPDGTGIPAVRSVNGGVHPEGDPMVLGLVESFVLSVADARVYAAVDEDPNLLAGERSIVFADGQALVVDNVGITAFRGGSGLPENHIAFATSFVLPPLPPDPDVYAESVREDLYGIADAATLTEDQSSGFGIFDAWEDDGFTVVAADQLPVGRGQVSATAVDLPPDTAGGYTAGIYFAVADDADNCAGGFIVIALPEGDPSAGFITVTQVPLPAGSSCTGESVVLAARRG